MKYQEDKFSVPVGAHKMTDREYEIRVGIRCAKCKKKTEKCKCPK